MKLKNYTILHRLILLWQRRSREHLRLQTHLHRSHYRYNKDRTVHRSSLSNHLRPIEACGISILSCCSITFFQPGGQAEPGDCGEEGQRSCQAHPRAVSAAGVRRAREKGSLASVCQISPTCSQPVLQRHRDRLRQLAGVAGGDLRPRPCLTSLFAPCDPPRTGWLFTPLVCIRANFQGVAERPRTRRPLVLVFLETPQDEVLEVLRNQPAEAGRGGFRFGA